MSEAYAAYLNRQYMEDYLKRRGIPAYVFHHYLGSVVRVPTPDFNASTHIKTEVIAYVCPHCGALNYGQWGIPQLELTFNPKYPSETAYRLQDLQEANIMYEFGEKNNHVELLVEVGLEADKNNRLCGICGQTLSAEPGYKKQCSLVKPLPSIRILKSSLMT